MFYVNPVGNNIKDPNNSFLKQMEKGTFTHWIIHQSGDATYRALYNGFAYWVMVFREFEDGSLIYLFDLFTEPEIDEEGETYLPNVSEDMIRKFLEWD